MVSQTKRRTQTVGVSEQGSEKKIFGPKSDNVTGE
jgi:hypothetical protein